MCYNETARSHPRPNMSIKVAANDMTHLQDCIENTLEILSIRTHEIFL